MEGGVTAHVCLYVYGASLLLEVDVLHAFTCLYVYTTFMAP